MIGRRLINPNNVGAFNGGMFNGLEYQLVTNATTGKVWLDRNLGATQVATSSTDINSYGDLYQWGRLTDGHQIRTSGTTSTQSSGDVPGNSNFIYGYNDWRSPKNDSLWQGVTGINNPSPNGFRLPTEAEWNAEIASWSSANSSGAYGSVLKLTMAGYRNYFSSVVEEEGNEGDYWASSINVNSANRMLFYSSGASVGAFSRAFGFSVRCIKD